MNRRKKAENPENMSLVGHLREIRNRIAVSIAAFVVAFIACFAVIKPLADALLHMGIEYGFAYVYLAPSELLTAYVKLSLVVALCRSGAYERGKARGPAGAGGRVVLLFPGGIVLLQDCIAVHDPLSGGVQRICLHPFVDLCGQLSGFHDWHAAHVRACL